MGRKLKYLVLHCTATPQGRKVTADEIRAWHTDPKPKGNGWKQVGYTDMIRLDGTIDELVKNNDDNIVDSWEITNGAAGHNSVSRHIVYVGGLDRYLHEPKDTRTPEQKEALKKFCLEFHAKYPDVKIVGHNELSGKACPSFDVPQWLRSIGINQ